MEENKQEILLESGTNELEIIEFYVGTQPLGINVQKLKEIITFDESSLTVVPESHPAILGTLLLRGSMIPLLDLRKYLNQRQQGGVAEEGRPVVMVCEFNHRINGFKVEGVNQIHRISWSDVEPLAPILNKFNPQFTGSVHIDDREVLLLDLESIVGELDSNSVLKEPQGSSAIPVAADRYENRRKARILMAEDSTIIRSGIAKILRKAGLDRLEVFADGEQCYRRVLELKGQVDASGGDIRDHLKLVISDIEMPKMDGLTLCRKIKEDLGFKQLPVLLFSSLINPPMEVKCDSVGADDYASKPELDKLIGLIDKYIGADRGID
jgi:two-component system chemotaxis response regulator CheV